MQFSTLILALAASTSLSLAQPIAMEHVESIIEVPSSSTPSVLEAREPLFGSGRASRLRSITRYVYYTASF
jgi:hypothetical protein